MFENGEKMKTVKRILLGLFGLVMRLVILLAGSIAIDFAIGGERINAVTNTTRSSPPSFRF